MATPKESAQEEEIKSDSTEKGKKMRKCYEYMSNLKKLLSKSEYSQFLVYLRMSRDNYMKEKIIFYVNVAFQIFFPQEIKASISNYELRKSLFSQSKYFFPKTDREAYSIVCEDLMRRMDKDIHLYLITQSCKPMKDDICEEIKSPEFTEWQKKPLEERIKINSDKVSKETDDVDMNLMNTEKVMVRVSGIEGQKKPSPEKLNLICMICFEDYEDEKKFAKAKCGHVACWDCWNQWLYNCLECPMCKQRTRLKQLVNLP